MARTRSAALSAGTRSSTILRHEELNDPELGVELDHPYMAVHVSKELGDWWVCADETTT
jgi:hypothetical protein